MARPPRKGVIVARGLSLPWKMSADGYLAERPALATPGGACRISQRVKSFDFELFAFVRRPDGLAGLMTFYAEDFVSTGPETVPWLEVLAEALAEVYGEKARLPVKALISVIEAAQLIDVTHPDLPAFGRGSALALAFESAPEYASVRSRGLFLHNYLNRPGTWRSMECVLEVPPGRG